MSSAAPGGGGSASEEGVGSTRPPGSGGEPQSLIPAGVWQAAVLLDKSPDSWGLFGAVVVPAFEYSDFTSGSGAELAAEFPAAAGRISELGLL